jgi:two-component system, OmpR family, sensor kinase
MTIRKKLILLYSGMLAIVIIVFGFVIFTVIRSTWIESVDNSLWLTVDEVRKNSSSYVIREFGAPVGIGIDFPEVDVFRASGVFVEVWVADGDALKLSSSSANLGSYSDPLDSDSLKGEFSVYSTVKINNTELRVLTSPFRLIGQSSVAGYIQAADSLQTVNQATEKLSLFILFGGGVAVLLSVILGTWLSNQSLKPIEAITQAADNISTAKDLATRLPWDGPPDELGRLTSVFNHMMDRLERLFEVQQRFVADVSHELRTPLTAIRGNLDIIRRYGLDEPSLEAIESETERMSRMVTDLLTLARADGGSLTLEMHEVDLDTVVTDVFREAKILAQTRDLQIRVPRLEPMRIQGNSDRLKQLLLNLVGNAIKFTPDGGQISLSLWRESGSAVLQVSDTGIGIKPEDLEHIFDRFYQADSSRVRAHTGDGAGLGLSIAKWIAEAHHGSIEAESTLGSGTTFTVRLPLAEAQPEQAPAPEELSYSTMALQRLRLGRKRRATAATTPEG